MASQSVILPFPSGNITSVTSANPAWVNPGNAAASDDSRAVVTFTTVGSTQSSADLRALGLTTTDLPRYALPTAAAIRYEIRETHASTSVPQVNFGELRYDGSALGTRQNNNLTPNGSDSVLEYTYADLASPALTRTIVASSTFGVQTGGFRGASGANGDTLELDYISVDLDYDDRTPEGLAATVVTGGIRFTWNRGFLSNTVYDWRSGLMAGADPSGNTYLYKGFIEYEVQLSDTGDFAGEETTHYVPSVSTARSADDLYTESSGLADPDELAFVRIVEQTGTHQRWARVRLIVRNTSTGAVLESSPYCTAVSATYDASADPEWVNRGMSVASASNFAPNDPPLIAFGELIGGSLSTGADQANFLRINLDTFNTDDSVPDYFRGLRDALKAGTLASHTGKYAFLGRAPGGVNSVMTDTSPGSEAGTELYDYQGGTNATAANATQFNNNGLGTSPAMLPFFWTYQHAAGIADATDKARLQSLADDYESARSGESQVYFHYTSLFGAAHMIIDDTQGDPTDADVLAAWCLPMIMDAGGVPCFDVLFNAKRYNQFRGSEVENPEARLVRACIALNIFIFGERLGETANDSYWRTLDPDLIGSIDAFNLIFDDSAYKTAREAAADDVRLDMTEYIATGETDIGTTLGFLRLVRINTTICSYVNGDGSLTNEQEMARSLIVAKDLQDTWPLLVVPVIEPQTSTDEMAQADVDGFFSHVTANFERSDMSRVGMSLSLGL